MNHIQKDNLNIALKASYFVGCFFYNNQLRVALTGGSFHLFGKEVIKMKGKSLKEWFRYVVDRVLNN